MRMQEHKQGRMLARRKELGRTQGRNVFQRKQEQRKVRLERLPQQTSSW